MIVTLKLNGSPISMELDTGAGITIVSKQTYNQLWRGNNRPPLQSSTVHHNTYTGEKLSSTRGDQCSCGIEAAV